MHPRTFDKRNNQQTNPHQRITLLRIHTPSSGIKEVSAFGILLCFVLSCFLMLGCAQGTSPNEERAYNTPSLGQSGPACEVSEVRYPTTEEDFADENRLYGHRGFLDVYQGCKHLAHDAKLVEGTPVHPIACGKVVFYGPATGYGTLVVAIEHTLPWPVQVVNGDGDVVEVQKFLSIYGHQRKTESASGGNPLPFAVGSTVQPGDVISYVQGDALNGDGPEHLHLGIRLQSESEAKQTDGALWLRGNDTAGEGMYKKYFADPATFIPALQNELTGNTPDPQVSFALHHPIGTLLEDAADQSEWLVVNFDSIIDVSSVSTLPRSCKISVSHDTLDCYRKLDFHPFMLELDAPVVKFQGSPEVFKLYPSGGFAAESYQAFLSYDAFLSWGYSDASIQTYGAAEKQQVLGGLEQKPAVGFMPGALVKASGQSAVFIANQNGERTPIFNWDVFLKLGYSSECIYELDPSVLDVLAGAESADAFTMNDAQICAAQSGTQICTPGASINCACPDGSVGTQPCNDEGTAYEACICTSGGSGGSGCEPGTYRTCICDDQQSSGTQTCSSSGEWLACLLCDQGTGGSGGSSGAGGSSSQGGSGGTAGSSGTGGSSSSGGSAGAGGSSTQSYLVEIEFDGPSYSMDVPDVSIGWAGTGVQELGCQSLASKKVLCTYQMISMSQVSSVEGQVQLTDWGANDLYWGDASGNSYSVCLTQADINAMHSNCLTINGTVCMRVNGQPHNMQPCSNGYPKLGSCMDCCDESPQEPYFNFCAD